MNYPKYFRCDKCGQRITKVDSEKQMNSMCTGGVTYRISGICGGSFSVEMTEDEYNKQLKDWEERKK